MRCSEPLRWSCWLLPAEPAAQPSCPAPPSLSLGSLGVSSRFLNLNMNIDTIKPWLESAASALATFKALKELLPAGPKRDEAERLVAEAEHKLKLAEGRMALDLGFALCKHCWPPEIMLYEDDGELRCRQCHREDPNPTVVI